MTSKQITKGGEKIVAKEGKAWSVGQNYHPEVRMEMDDVVSGF